MRASQRNGGAGDIAQHVGAIRACNQRGGRMLTLVDLIEARTVDGPLAAYLAAVMRSGGSLLVGAQPGGAGKTTVMCALLNFLPPATSLQAIEGRAVLRRGLADDAYGATCYLAHEIGDGSYYAYVWGEEARTFFRLAGAGHLIASNLHADTLGETRAQLCDENGVAPEHLDAVTLKLYLRLDRGAGWRVRRRISHVYECPGDGGDDRLVWTGERGGAFERQTASAVVTPEEEQRCADLLARLRSRGVKTIEGVRRAVVENLAETPSGAVKA